MALAPAAMFLHAVGEDGGGEQRRCRGAVADILAGALRRLAHYLHAEVLFRIFQLEFLGDRHAVVAHDRPPPFLLDEDAFRFRSQRDAHGVGECETAMQNLLPGFRSDEQLLASHVNLQTIYQERPRCCFSCGTR